MEKEKAPNEDESIPASAGGPSFFKAYQADNINELIKQSIKKVIPQWLSDDEKRSARERSIAAFLGHDVSNANIEGIMLPRYIQRVWSQPYEMFPELIVMPVEKIRASIKLAIKEALSEPKSDLQMIP